MLHPPWVRPFLEALEKTGNVSAAARLCGTDRTTVYSHRKRDEEFKGWWDEALEVAVEHLELECRRRALHGVEKAVFFHGERVDGGKVREYSDVLLMFLLKAQRPLKYRENVDVGLSGGLNIVDMVTEAEKRAEERRRERETDGASE